MVTGVPKPVGCVDRRRRHDGLLRGRRPARLGVGQRRAAGRDAGRLRAGAAAGARRGRRLGGAVAAPTCRRRLLDVLARRRLGWTFLALLAPAFVISPGLLQKIFGARDDRAVRVGVGLNALGAAAVRLRAGAARHGRARARSRARRHPNLALPTLLHARAAAARRRARRWRRSSRPRSSTADAMLFMLSTSLSQDLYKRFLNPRRTRRAGCCAWRAWRPSAAASLGVLLAMCSADDRRRADDLLLAARRQPVRAGASAASTCRGAGRAARWRPSPAGVGVTLVVQVATGGSPGRLTPCARPGARPRLVAAWGWCSVLGPSRHRRSRILAVLSLHADAQAAVHDDTRLQDCGHRRRRHRQGSHPGGHRGHRGGDAGHAASRSSSPTSRGAATTTWSTAG